ncbi:MAG: hypothetical protein KGJ56_07720 [Gammaproteobacteria bacterium]|nr:hypothetical protein [Gammaproteobacteria bacterium]
MRRIVLMLVTALCGGCASYAAHEQARALAVAVKDDQTCLSRGLRFPQPEYVTCRLRIDDARLHKDWMNLQLMHQTQYQTPYMPPAYPGRETYRPLDRDRYHCRYTTENGQDYILCGEDNRN